VHRLYSTAVGERRSLTGQEAPGGLSYLVTFRANGSIDT